MLKITVIFTMTLVFAYFIAWFGPWWFPIGICILVAGWKFRHAVAGFLFGAMILLALWMGTALYWNSMDTTGLSVRMASLFSESIPVLQIFKGSSLIFFLIAIFAVVLGGLAGWSGVCLKRLLFGSHRISVK